MYSLILVQGKNYIWNRAKILNSQTRLFSSLNEIRPDTARIPKSIFVSNKKINEEVDEGEKEKIIAAQNMKKKK